MRSLRARLGLGLASGLLVVFILQWLVVTLAIRHIAEAFVASRLEHDADTIVAALQTATPMQSLLEDPRLAGVFHQPYSGHYFRITIGDRVVRSRSLWDQDLAVDRAPSGAQLRIQQPGPQNQSLLVLVRGVLLKEQEATLAVAEDLTPLRSELQRFNLQYAIVSGGALAVLLLIQQFALWLGLRPLMRIRAELDEVKDGAREQLSERVPHEMQSFVRELNAALATLRERLVRSRRALGNLAHALKTPLTLLSDLSSDKRLGRWPDIRRPMQTHTQSIANLIDRELKRARLAGAATGAAALDVQGLIDELVTTITAIHREKAVAVQREAPRGRIVFRADREDMLELLGNVIDNAFKWAHAAVRLDLAINDSLRITVEDDGPGCDAARLRQIGRRGVRLDETVPGHGLGLAIAHDIALSYRGQLAFDRSPSLGGLRVVITLPKYN